MKFKTGDKVSYIWNNDLKYGEIVYIANKDKKMYAAKENTSSFTVTLVEDEIKLMEEIK